MNSLLNPILKWVGGKRWLVPIIQYVWCPYQDQGIKLVEPFTGGMAIALGLNPTQALLNDTNPHLINFYQQIQNGLQIKTVFKNNATFYYKSRTKFNQLIKNNKTYTKEAAELFFFLIKTGYNGLCRFNKNGEFNVPFGRHININYQFNSIKYQTIIKKWQFSCHDFQNIQLKGDEFLYADPPYDVLFTNYYSKKFDWPEQIRLAKWLSKQSGLIITSNQATQRIIELYKDLKFNIVLLPAPRSISCNGNRKPALEILAFRNFNIKNILKLTANFNLSLV